MRSFIIFLYADGEIQWTSGDGSHGVRGLGGIPAQVGFNEGDGRRHAVIPASYTDAIINITHTSNVDIPGVWVFQVDEEDVVIGGCQSATSNENGTVFLLHIFVCMYTICLTTNFDSYENTLIEQSDDS